MIPRNYRENIIGNDFYRYEVNFEDDANRSSDSFLSLQG